MTNAASSATERVALVAGASRGIGADVARAFATAGYAVVLGARDTDALQHVVDDITAAGGRAVAGATDVGDETSMRALVERAVGTFGRLDAAFNNATDGPMPAPLADIETAEFDRGIRTNVRGTFLGMKYEIPALLSSGGGAIVNMASVAGVRATTNLAAYVAGKAAIIGLTEVAALDYADRGIRVNVVAPGPILTHHLERAGAEAQRLAGQSVPMGRIGSTAEVADVVLWLCSDQSSFVTGATVPIDGGQLAGNKPPQMYRQGEGMAPTAADRSITTERSTMMTTTDEIRQLGERWAAAEVAADTTTLESMITDDFRLVGPFGFILDRQQWLDRYRSGDFTTTALTWHDVEIREYGDTAVSIGTQTQEAAYKGTPSNGDFRVGHVFVRRDGRWLIAGIQLSLTSPPGPPAGA